MIYGVSDADDVIEITGGVFLGAVDLDLGGVERPTLVATPPHHTTSMPI